MIATTLLALAFASLPQDPNPKPSEAQIQKQLVAKAREYLEHKDEPRLVARGAWLAAEHRLVATKDLLLARLKHERKWSMGWEHAMHSLLDAMIQNRIQAPQDLCLSLARRGYDSEVLILLSLSSEERRETLLALFRMIPSLEDPTPHAWQAAGNLLAMKADPGFVATLIQDLSIDRWIDVHDDDPRRLRTKGGEQAVSCWKVVQGFPPAVFYPLISTPEPGDILLAPGPKPVFYRRLVYRRKQFCLPGLSDRFSKANESRIQWLYGLAEKTQDKLPLASEVSQSVDHPGYAAACLRIREACLLAHRELLMALRKRGLWKGKDPELDIRWHIRDIRARQKPALAALPWMKKVEIRVPPTRR